MNTLPTTIDHTPIPLLHAVLLDKCMTLATDTLPDLDCGYFSLNIWMASQCAVSRTTWELLIVWDFYIMEGYHTILEQLMK